MQSVMGDTPPQSKLTVSLLEHMLEFYNQHWLRK